MRTLCSICIALALLPGCASSPSSPSEGKTWTMEPAQDLSQKAKAFVAGKKVKEGRNLIHEDGATKLEVVVRNGALEEWIFTHGKAETETVKAMVAGGGAGPTGPDCEAEYESCLASSAIDDRPKRASKCLRDYFSCRYARLRRPVTLHPNFVP